MPTIEDKLENYEVLQDNHGKEYTKHSILQSIVLFGCTSGGGPWLNCVSTMGKWYEINIHTYQTGTTGKAMGRKGWYPCPLINNREVADDCSGFVQACLMYFGVDCPPIRTASMQEGTIFMELMEKSGFMHYNGQFYPDNLLPGDIVCGAGGTHTEIYAGENKSWSWGNIHDGINGHKPMPCLFARIDSRGGYIHCWRKI